MPSEAAQRIEKIIHSAYPDAIPLTFPLDAIIDHEMCVDMLPIHQNSITRETVLEHMGKLARCEEQTTGMKSSSNVLGMMINAHFDIAESIMRDTARSQQHRP